MAAARDISNLQMAEETVESICEHYRDLAANPDPVVSKVLEDEAVKKYFQTCVQMELKIIYKVSPNLEDHAVNIMQKALLTLVSQGQTEAGTRLFLYEILGLRAEIESEKLEDIKEKLQLRGIVEQKLIGMVDAARKEGLLISNNTPGIMTNSATQTVSPRTDENDPELGAIPQAGPAIPIDDSKLDRLFTMYIRAKTDFEAAPTHTFEQTHAARFLRDTAENCLNYLQSLALTDRLADRLPAQGPTISKDVTDRILGIKRVIATASAVAERGSGGKRRRFDTQAEEEEEDRKKRVEQEEKEEEEKRMKRQLKEEIEKRRREGRSRSHLLWGHHSHGGRPRRTRTRSPPRVRDCYGPRYREASIRLEARMRHRLPERGDWYRPDYYRRFE